ncbi:MAG TPA: spheroidene monooxygenase, partial [Acidimicrobiia bacterium]|nr:spheroidene monooxygenase [Acidimicrobiia bacterium]
MVIASVHLAEVGIRALPSVLRGAPRAGSMPGLRQANVAIAAPLRTGPIPSLPAGRVGYVAFWDDDAALDEFLSAPFAQKLSSGWSARLEPLRMHGAWPGMPTTTPAGRSVDYDGPAVVATLARTNMT